MNNAIMIHCRGNERITKESYASPLSFSSPFFLVPLQFILATGSNRGEKSVHGTRTKGDFGNQQEPIVDFFQMVGWIAGMW
jgi:hypothetical protein